MFTAVVTIILIGFHPALPPSFIVKIVPTVAGLPTWTTCVAYVVWQRKHETPRPVEATVQPETPDHEAQHASDTPAGNRPDDFIAPEPARHGASALWLLVSGVLLAAAWCWHRHQPHRATNAPQYASQPEAAMPPANAPTLPRVVVAPIENESSSDASLAFGQSRHFTHDAGGQPGFAPERVRMTLEDIVQGIDGVTLLERQQAQLFASRYEAGATGASLREKQAQLRAIMAPNIIVFGAILDIHEDKTDIKAYGTDMQSLHSECSVRVQVMDSSNGSITFTKTLTASQTKTQGAHVSATSTDDQDYELLKSALEKLAGDAAFKSAVLGFPANQSKPD